ncbi:hypothetical protein [Bradyrhizobium sp. I1.7.5]|uniref:hypothetical protein n=1 Tax=Bradyrhizobium sp. I1.7.5 TaxID=3156363 RepID=UPI003397C9EA
MLSLIRGCGGYTMISKDLLGCATSRNKGTCDNRLNIRRDALEASVLSGLRTHMEPDLFKEFCDEFTREVNRLRIERGAGLAAMRDELPRIERELGKLLAAIKAGGPIEAIVEDMKRLEARKAVLKDQLANAEEPPPLLHPNMAEIYRQRIAALYESLQNEDGKTETAEVFRTLVDQVTLVPDKAELAIVLRGDLASILRFAANRKNPDVLSEAGVLVALLSQESLVAGTRNTRFRRNGTGVFEIGVSQEMMVVGARITRFLRLVETVIPRLAAWTIAFPKVEVTRSHRVWCATSLQNWALQKTVNRRSNLARTRLANTLCKRIPSLSSSGAHCSPCCQSGGTYRDKTSKSSKSPLRHTWHLVVRPRRSVSLRDAPRSFPHSREVPNGAARRSK